jgi:iron complex outermembrane receptor protein
VVSGPSALQYGALVGSPLPKTPKWKINLSPRYEYALPGGGKIVLIGDYTYTSKLYNNVERTKILTRDAVTNLNASIAYTDPSNRFTLTVGGTNITNRRYLTSGTAIPAFGAIVGTYSRPAEWFTRLAFKL